MSDVSKSNFFEGLEGLIQEFEFDYEAIVDFKWQLYWRTTLCVSAFPPALVCNLLGLPYHCLCAYDNLKDDVEATHVALTQDGVRHVVAKHKNGVRMDCNDVGKVSKTVPYDKLTDCDVEEPAGAEGPVCCMVPRTLYVVNVDTASGDRSTGGHELTIMGLKDSQSFKEMVWKVKRGELSAVAPAQQQIGGGGGGGSGGGVFGNLFGKPSSAGESPGELGRLLGKNNELLQQSNKLLEQIAANTKP